MKKFLLLLSMLFDCSYVLYAIDPAPPHVVININNKSNLTIDSVFAYADTSHNHMRNSYENNFYSSAELKEFDNQICCSNRNHYFKIKVRFTDSSIIYSNVTFENEYYGKFDATVEKTKIIVKKNYDEIISNSINILIYLFIASFVLKVLFYVLKFKVTNKLVYSIKYTTINFLNLILMYFVIEFFDIDYSILMILMYGLIVPHIIDSYFHKKDLNILAYSSSTIRIVNILFYTVGLFGLTILWLILRI